MDANLLAGSATALFSGVPAIDMAVLSDGDAYYYTTLHRVVQFPVVRVRFQGSSRTGSYLDTRTGQVVEVLSRKQRLYRWLYHGLHSWDWPLLLKHDGRRRAVLCAIGVAGLLSALTGTVLALRWLLTPFSSRAHFSQDFMS